MNNFFFKIQQNSLFQFLVIFIIILNAITLGINTYEINSYIKRIIELLDYAITIFFVIEILIRFIGEPKKLNFLKMAGMFLIV